MRKIIIDLNFLTEDQQLLDNYEKAYNCTLYEGPTSPWGKEYNEHTGQWIPYSWRKPDFVDPLPREVVDSITASIFGYDKFPAIQAKSYDMAYEEEAIREMEYREGNDLSSLEEIESDSEKGYEWLGLSNEHLRKFVSALLPQKLTAPSMMEAARMALIAGRCMVYFRFSGGKPFLEIINSKWIKNLRKDPINPDKILGFREQYMFEEDDPDNPGRTKKYWFRRDFDENEEIVYFPVEVRRNEIPQFIKDKKNSHKHGFDFCPAVQFEGPNGKSLFHGQIENIKAYTYLTNCIHSGIRQTMSPQWFVTYSQAPTVNSSEPKRKGGIWLFPGATGVNAMAPDQKGFDSARQWRKEIRDEMIRAWRVENDTSNLNYQSGAAIQLRLSPIHDAIGEYRIWFGDRSFLNLCQLIIDAAIILFHRDESSLDLPGNIMVPSMDARIDLSLSWGQIKPITEDDILKSVTNALTAYKGGLITKERAVRYIARHFDIDDIEDMVKLLDRLEHEQKEEEMEQQMLLFLAKSKQKREQVDVVKPEQEKLKSLRQGD